MFPPAAVAASRSHVEERWGRTAWRPRPRAAADEVRSVVMRYARIDPAEGPPQERSSRTNGIDVATALAREESS
jgi:hypothetical protein